MKHFYVPLSAHISLFITSIALLISQDASAQSCTPQGNESTFGTNNTWIGYVYQGMNFNTYKGFVTEGNATNPNFDESFGGNQVNYNTNGCAAYTDTFSVRYKLTQSFAPGNYIFTVGGDDGFRFSLDGGTTWAINQWNDQGYATATYTLALSGTYNMVLEYYEHFGSNRISFTVAQICTGTGDPTVYGTNNLWNGYIYQGMNFNMYKGQVTEGTSSNPAFDENFGTSGNTPVTYYTNSCSIQTQQFSARYRLQQTLTPAKYAFVIGGDDGYRFSLDGGATWVINQWQDQSYKTSSYTANLSGTYNMVLEYYQNGGANRINFSMSSSTLPVTLVNWTAKAISADEVQLQWACTDAVNFDHFIIQKSRDGVSFYNLETVPSVTSNSIAPQKYSYTDRSAINGTVFYRLAMVDIDGTTTYSSISRLSGDAAQNIRIFPTMVENGNLFIEAASTISRARLELFDMTGRKINEKEWAVLDGRQQVSLNGNNSHNLPTGSYIVRLSDNQSILAKQIIIVK